MPSVYSYYKNNIISFKREREKTIASSSDGLHGELKIYLSLPINVEALDWLKGRCLDYLTPAIAVSVGERIPDTRTFRSIQ